MPRAVADWLAPTTPAAATQLHVPHGAVAGAIRWHRILPIVVTSVFLLAAAYSLAILLTDPRFAGWGGSDFGTYRQAASRWLGGGPFYYPEQIAGPYYTLSGHVLYPPIALVLFVPFTVLPGVLWWLIPLGIVAWRVVTLWPSPWALAAIAACLACPYTIELLVFGNPVIWVVAALAISTRWPALGALVLLKPSLFPFAISGYRTRAWWLALGCFGLVSLAFLPMWPQWILAVLNTRGPSSGLLYSIKDVPMMLIPVLAWMGRSPGRLRASTPVDAEAQAWGQTRRPSHAITGNANIGASWIE